ncbi:MAG TPA: sugar phosphate isomerase/epimerase [Dehalococcoidia bacterium]|jgi:sugar phosphate isomerase/epimerase|nr:sugar phosphate isomerase/epimerase [Dehalococcoidia bacterium]
MSELPAPIHALSTMWSQGRFRDGGRDTDDMIAFAEATARLGFPAIEINYVIPPEGVEALLTNSHVAITSLHSPTPRIKTPNGKSSEALNLASPDEDERALAVERARVTIDNAVRCGARYIVVHLGGIDGGIFEEERELRKRYDAGERDGADVDVLRRRAVERRAEAAPTFMPHARRSLAEIGAHAAAQVVAVGLENRYHYHEFPGPGEMRELLDEYPPEVAGFWLDVGHAEVLDRLGLERHERWLDELGDRCIGTHVHDVDGLADHRAPGHGTADWPHYAAKLPPQIPRIFEINQKMPEEQVAASIPFLKECGVLPTR